MSISIICLTKCSSCATFPETSKLSKFISIPSFVLRSFSPKASSLTTLEDMNHTISLWVYATLRKGYALVDEQTSKDKAGDEAEVQVSGLHNWLEKLDLKVFCLFGGALPNNC
jgi:hypothetical protein